MAAERPAIPFDLDAERAVVVGLLRTPAELYRLPVNLEPAHFFDPEARELYAGVCSLVDTGASVSPTALRGWLKTQGSKLDLARPIEIVDETPAVTPDGLRQQAERVFWFARHRLMLTALRGLVGSGAQSDSVPWLSEVERSVYEHLLVERREATISESLDQLTVKLYERGRGVLDGLETTLPKLNRRIGGWSEFCVIGARPGTGKTAWAVQEVRKVAARGDAALMFSLEMPASQLVERMVIQDGPIDAGRMKFGQLTPDDLHNFERSKRLLASSPIEIVDKPGICLPELRSRVRRAKARAQALLGKQLRLVVIDYIQLMGGPAHSREERVAENSKGLLGISKEFDVTVIALSQLNRGSARDGSKARSPTMDDLRESGQIEQDATTIVLLWSPDENQVSLREIVVAKCRTGTPGRMPAWFEGKHLTLMDLDEDYAGVEGITGDDFFDRL